MSHFTRPCHWSSKGQHLYFAQFLLIAFLEIESPLSPRMHKSYTLLNNLPSTLLDGLLDDPIDGKLVGSLDLFWLVVVTRENKNSG